MKECGDVLWHSTGLLRNSGVALSDLVGPSLLGLKSTPMERDPEILLVLSAGAIAGCFKRFQRGDYSAERLRDFVLLHLKDLLCALSGVCAQRGRSLLDAAFMNKCKIEKRLQTNMIQGNGSNRGEH